MTSFRLISRSLMHYRRMHTGLLLGVMLACAILTGALLMGDSIDYSLREIASLRLGRIAYAMTGNGNFFRKGLVERMQVGESRIASALVLRGVASTPPDGKRAPDQLNRVEIIGIESDFWRLAQGSPLSVSIDRQEAVVNEKVANALGVHAGDDISIRAPRYSAMPLDAPLSSREREFTASALVTVKAVLSDAQFGRFSLAANQTTPYNIFVDRRWLQEQTGHDGLANLVVADDTVSVDELHKALDTAWQLEDLGLRVRAHPSGVVQIESEHVFLEDEVIRAAKEIPNAKPTLTYLVNSISKGERSTPYSFVEAGPLAEDINDGEVIVNEWLAAQLSASPGDMIDISYFHLLATNALEDRRNALKIQSAVPMNALAIERELAPKFPGLSDVENCRDWSIGMPMDEALLKDAPNEAYWKQYGQTPKLFTNYNTGQQMWRNRFGAATAVRISDSDEPTVRRLLRDKISVDKLGFRFTPVRQIALDAVSEAIDFGGLFVGMSFFLIVAALILLGLLYVFGVQQRSSEIGVLLALGFSRPRVARIFLLEALPTLLLGACIGSFAGMGYARLLIEALTHFWPAAVAGASIRFHAGCESLLIGVMATIFGAVLIVAFALWRNMRHTPHELITSDLASSSATVAARTRRWFMLFPTLFLVAAIALAANVWITKPASLIEPFFGIGTCLLLSGLGFHSMLLSYLAGRVSFRNPRLWKVALTNLARRRGRSLSVAGLTACGCFLVFSVASMQENIALHAGERSSGTGGFAVFAETTVPIVSSPAALAKKLGNDAVPLKIRDGDDASCLNLNRAKTPRLVGVSAKDLSTLGAFGATPTGDFWNLLDKRLPDGLVPALVGDSDTAMWTLKAHTGETDGDVLSYTGDSGGEFRVKLVGRLPMRLSVFQGSILISDSAFTRMFPFESGFRAFLVDAPQDQARQVSARLNRDFERFGMQAVPSVERLREFYAVESTYLAMFLILGGLGLILGGAGVGIVVLRNLFERGTEIALLDALGFRRADVYKLLLLEHSVLALSGAAIGALASASAIIPLIMTSQTALSPRAEVILLAFIIAANVACVGIALLAGFPRNAVTRLREE